MSQNMGLFVTVKNKKKVVGCRGHIKSNGKNLLQIIKNILSIQKKLEIME